jgi:hypothetical protein
MTTMTTAAKRKLACLDLIFFLHLISVRTYERLADRIWNQIY